MPYLVDLRIVHAGVLVPATFCKHLNNGALPKDAMRSNMLAQLVVELSTVLSTNFVNFVARQRAEDFDDDMYAVVLNRVAFSTTKIVSTPGMLKIEGENRRVPP